MAASSSQLCTFISSFTPFKPPQPKAPSLTFLPNSSRANHGPPSLSVSSNPSPSTDYEVSSVVNPALSNANILFFRSAYNVQVVVEENEHEEKLINRFRREVMRAGVIQECRRRRYFENTQEKVKRKTREAAKRNKKRRPYRPQTQDKPETTSKQDNDDEDNWEMPVGELPS